jgi:hypothetical protein
VDLLPLGYTDCINYRGQTSSAAGNRIHTCIHTYIMFVPQDYDFDLGSGFARFSSKYTEIKFNRIL